MTIVFPNALDTFVDPTAANNLNDPTVLHSTQHANLNDAVLALETKVGANGTGVISVSAGPVVIAAKNGQTIYTVYESTAITFELPAAAGIDQIVIIVDAEGAAGTNAITIQGNGNEIIAYSQSAATSIQINANGGSISLAWDGSFWVQYA